MFGLRAQEAGGVVQESGVGAGVNERARGHRQLYWVGGGAAPAEEIMAEATPDSDYQFWNQAPKRLLAADERRLTPIKLTNLGCLIGVHPRSSAANYVFAPDFRGVEAHLWTLSSKVNRLPDAWL